MLDIDKLINTLVMMVTIAAIKYLASSLFNWIASMEKLKTTNITKRSIAALIDFAMVVVLFIAASIRFQAGQPLTGADAIDLLALSLFGAYIVSSIVVRMMRR